VAGLTISNADAVLKEFYLAPVREQLNNAVKTLAQFEKNYTDMVGRRALVPIHVSRNSGIGARADGGSLPTAGVQGYADALVPVKHQYGRIKVTGPTIRATARDEGAFIRAVDSEMKGVVNDLRSDINRQVFGTSDGVKATCGTTTTSNTVQLLAASTTLTQMRQFSVGELVDIGTVASPTAVASARQITAVDRANRTITVDGATLSTTSSTHKVFRSGNGGDVTNSSQKEITGLRTIVASSGTLFSVDPSTYPVWVSSVDSNSGTNRQLTEDLIQGISDSVEIESGKAPGTWVTSFGVAKSFGNLLSAQKRFVNTVALKAGWSGIELNTGEAGAAMAKDKDCPENTAFALNPDSFTEYRMADFDWADYDGRSLRNVAGEDAWEAFIVVDHELGCHERNANGILKDLSE
jgi:hypothetical protein